MYDVLHSHLVNLTGSNACPTVTATPETVKAAFTKESDIFAENGVAYMGSHLEPCRTRGSVLTRCSKRGRRCSG